MVDSVNGLRSQLDVGKRQRVAGRALASVLLHSTALAAGMLGLPVLAPRYGRVYAAASCTQSPTGTIDASTSFNCTVSSGSVNQPQVFYTGYGIWYNAADKQSDSQPGLPITVTSSADITVTGTFSTGSTNSGKTNYVAPLPTGTHQNAPRVQIDSLAGALMVFNVGNDTENSGNDVNGGDGAAVTVSSSGALRSTTGSPSGSTGFGIVAYSAGGHGSAANTKDDTAGDGGDGGAVTVGVYGQVVAQYGPGVFAASYGGSGGRTGKLGRGGAAGNVYVTVGSASQAAPAIAAFGTGTFGVEARVSGSAVAAISYGGDAYRDDGGNAGNARITITNGQSTAIQSSGSNAPALLALSYGGQGNSEGYSGGTAGTAGVYLSGSGTITTTGGRSPGIVVQSLGGLGQSKEVHNSKETAANGGAAGEAVVRNTFAITTSGSQAHGIIAQSAGAGGGIYAYTGSGTLGWGDQNIGSYGGNTVSVTNSGAIRTIGPDANGIVAQSIGGGGGHLDIQSSTGNAVIGGSAGSVAGNDVTVSNSGSIATSGDSYTSISGETESGGGIGILAQSIGGGGGSMAGGGSGSRLGGEGTGSTGGTVTVTNSGAISTAGADAHGILAQSIGGGGGQGRNSKGLFVATGGTGGTGGDGGKATVTSTAAIAVSGDYANGIMVQSVGGGGGTGGKATAIGLWGIGVAVAHGGSGGAGGAAGDAYAYTAARRDTDPTTTGSSIVTRGTNGAGLLVQSVGGGGGSGGAAKSIAGGVVGISLAFGGSGSGGGAGGTAKAQAAGNVTTYGYDSMGVVVQSVGGGGGQGGTASAKSFSVGVPLGPDGPTVSAAVSVAHGGSGGTASSGGYAYGVNFLSTGTNTRQTITTSANTVDASTGAVSLITIGAGASFKGITTFGDGSTGMLVQSVGGGGGAGGDATANSSAGVLQDQIKKIQESGGADDIESINVAVDVALGSTGGGGGAGGTAYGLNVGTITTFGLFADGMSVQSIGGGGGTGGSGNAKTTASGDTSVGLNVALGATGGAGGNGGKASGGVDAGGAITTYGNNSNGLLVQSIGAGGGNAGGGGGSTSSSFGLSIGLGANGATGGGGGNAYAWNKGAIVTHGDWSAGVLVQSVGGGGGNGGAGDSSLTVTTSSKFSDSYSASGSSTGTTASTNGSQSKPTADTFGLSLGTKGGGGGDAGTVVLGASSASGIPTDKPWTPGGTLGSVQTYGIAAHGLVAQSIGGGGGNAAVAPNSSSATATFQLGAAGGGGGAGGDVFVYAGNVTTSGFSSHGVLAQSIGGGGGTGVASGISGTISTNLGSGDISLETGANAGSSNKGGNVLVTTAAGGRIVTGKAVTIAGSKTYATDAFGILAQSIGGGGGTEIAAQGSSTASSGQGANDSHSITLGGRSVDRTAGHNDGGRVAVYHQGKIVTYGARGFGVVAQSIGGGGGMVSGDANSMSDVVFNSSPVFPGEININAYGNGGLTEVGLSNGASIVTHGAGAFGVLAQSIGGGGGFAGDSTQSLTARLSPFDGRAYGVGTGGNVYVTVGTGTSITTSGSNAHGIFAQSVSNGGGVWNDGSGMAAGTSRGFSSTAGFVESSSRVGVNVEGSVSVSGSGSWGVYAQNAGPNTTANPVKVYVSGAITASGSAAGAVRMMTYEGQSYLKTSGTGSITGNLYSNTTIDRTAASAAAIVVPQWNPHPITARFVNEGTFVSETYVTGLNVTNNGSLSIAGAGNFGETAFSHNIDGSGKIVDIDADFEHGRADRLIVAGEVGGRQTLVMRPVSLVQGGQVRFLQAGKVDDGALVFEPDSVFRYELVDKDGWKEIKVTDADFVGKAEGFDKNARAAAKALQGAWRQTGTEPATYDATTDRGTEITLGNLFAQFEGTDAATLESQLQAMQPFAATLGGTTAPRQGIDTANSVMSCPAFEDEGTILLEGQCVWIKGTGNWTDRSDHSDDPGYRTWAVGTALGGQKEIAPDWFLGGTAAYAKSDTNFDGGNESVNGQTATGAVALKRQLGPWLLGGAVGGGYTWADSKRDVALGTTSAEAKGSPDSSFLFARARVAYEVPFADWYLRPMLDLDAISFHQQSYEESGAGALNLDVDSNTETYFAATPGIELGGRLDLGNGFVLRPFTGVGVSFITNDNYTATSNFAAAPGGDSLQTTANVDNLLGRLTLGLDLMNAGGFQVKLDYNLQAGDDVVSQTGQIRFGYHF